MEEINIIIVLIAVVAAAIGIMLIGMHSLRPLNHSQVIDLDESEDPNGLIHNFLFEFDCMHDGIKCFGRFILKTTKYFPTQEQLYQVLEDEGAKWLDTKRLTDITQEEVDDLIKKDKEVPMLGIMHPDESIRRGLITIPPPIV